MNGSVAALRTVGVPSEVAVLAPFVQAGLFGPFEVQLRRVDGPTPSPELDLDHPGGPDVDDGVVLAIAMAALAPRFGHVCVDLARFEEQAAELFAEGATLETDLLPWPDPGSWRSILEDSGPGVGSPVGAVDRVRPLVLDGSRLYLQRLWHDEVTVAADLALGEPTPRASGLAHPAMTVQLQTALDDLFGPDDASTPRPPAGGCSHRR